MNFICKAQSNIFIETARYKFMIIIIIIVIIIIIIKPKYNRVTQGRQVNNHMLTNTDEARSFWKTLWEEEGSGDTEAEWI